MQSAILASNASAQVCSKMVYAGNLDQVDTDMAAYQAKYPTYTFVKYADDQDPAFVAAVVTNPEELTLV